MKNLWENDEEIKIFREYLRIKTVHPNINYAPCVEFLKRQADEIGLEFHVVYPSSEMKPLCIISYHGTNSKLKSIMLSSHMDVVPVDRECWSYDPFGAEMDDDGNIFARGSQDTKAIGTQYLAALRYFVRNKIQFKRTIHVTFTPEEEVGSIGGMKEFIETEAFKNLNVGFALDEGAPLWNEFFTAFYGERSTWQVEFIIKGEAGHGSIMIEDTAAVKLQRLLTKLTEYRQSEYARLSSRLDLQMIGRITSSNVTIINGGHQANVIPSEFKIMVDFRVSNDIDHEEFVKMFEGWCEEVGRDISYRLELREDKIDLTDISEKNKYWTTFKNSLDELGLKLIPIICPAMTDARFLRKVKIPAIGFSPMNFTPILAHAHNEFLNADIYLKGIEIYKKLIANLANMD
ncbi:hypothetical protein PVAND_007317 [Polypedilum vanderplanki]|uniref:N-acyl-aliphatic-L-amino acid amidohydrolase n=1 Tax=Polypedilum vanderplanki TaxID=319348 RepID=A0A9J6C6G6_POLVA|nr:hypothetical protein PVAND_007317 [Polypedilum vanderplanki]